MSNKLTTANAISAGMTAQHIATNLESYEAARSGFFVLKVSGLDNLLKSSYKGGIDDGDAADNLMNQEKAEECLTLSVTTCTIPHYEVSTESFTRGNDTVYFATTPKYNGGSIKVDDFVGLDVKSVLMAWLRLAYDPHTLKGGRMKNYKKTATLIEYTQDYEPIRTWTIYGMFITKLTEDDFNKESDSKRQISADFVYDRAEMMLPDDETESV